MIFYTYILLFLFSNLCFGKTISNTFKETPDKNLVPHEKQATPKNSQAILKFINKRASKKIIVEVEEVKALKGERMEFLEHVFNFNDWRATQDIIASSTRKRQIFMSRDCGKTWEKVWPNKRVKKNELGLEENEKKGIFRRCFTTSSGRHLLQLSRTNSNLGTIYIFDKDWNFIGKRSTGNYNWHGSWSIGEYKGVIMFSEYATGSEKLHVWRSRDDGNSWEIVFKQISHLTNSSQGDIRHFHTCFPWPSSMNKTNENGAWLVSSGDTTKQSKVWISYDHGNSWKNITDISFGIAKANFNRSIHRYTSLQYREDGSILWGTDDYKNINRSAQLIQARLNDNSNLLKLDILTPLWSNNTRVMISFDSHYLLISEAKQPDPEKVYLQVLNKQEPSYIEWAGTIKVKHPTGFTYTRSSIMAYDNIAFSYGMLRWKLREEDNEVLIK